MTGRQILGAALIALPFVAIVLYAQARDEGGWKDALLSFAIVAVVGAIFAAGLWLLEPR